VRREANVSGAITDGSGGGSNAFDARFSTTR